jgi:hypothetical protein
MINIKKVDKVLKQLMDKHGVLLKPDVSYEDLLKDLCDLMEANTDVVKPSFIYK